MHQTSACQGMRQSAGQVGRGEWGSGSRGRHSTSLRLTKGGWSPALPPHAHRSGVLHPSSRYLRTNSRAEEAVVWAQRALPNKNTLAAEGGIAGGIGDVAGEADQPLTFGLDTDTSGLPSLTSGGVAVTYAVVGTR